jgi:hypothetical protein
VKLWRKEISLPVNETAVIVDFLRKVHRPCARNSSTDPRDGETEAFCVPIHSAVQEAYEGQLGESLSSHSEQMIGQTQPVINQTSLPTFEEEELFLSAVSKFQMESMEYVTKLRKNKERHRAGDDQLNMLIEEESEVDYSRPPSPVRYQTYSNTIVDEYGDPGPSQRPPPSFDDARFVRSLSRSSRRSLKITEVHSSDDECDEESRYMNVSSSEDESGAFFDSCVQGKGVTFHSQSATDDEMEDEFNSNVQQCEEVIDHIVEEEEQIDPEIEITFDTKVTRNKVIIGTQLVDTDESATEIKCENKLEFQQFSRTLLATFRFGEPFVDSLPWETLTELHLNCE